MPSFMLDTNAINSIGYSELILESTIAAAKNERITLYVTHIQVDEINNIPDTNAEIRSRLQNFIRDYCTRVPTIGFVIGVSYLGAACLSDGKDVESIRQGNIKMIYDALIAATAKIGTDYLVTDDDTLRKRVIKEFPNLKLLTNDEFHKLIDD